MSIKRYNEQFNVGKSRYVVNYHDGVTLHKDGSPFFGAHVSSNKRQHARFIRRLVAQGYAAQ